MAYLQVRPDTLTRDDDGHAELLQQRSWPYARHLNGGAEGTLNRHGRRGTRGG